jgi:hypothetical protein
MNDTTHRAGYHPTRAPGTAVESGALVPITDPTAEDIEVQHSPGEAERLDLIRRTITWLARDSRNPHAVGVRVMVLAHLLNPEVSQSRLANMLGITAARVCQVRAELRRQLKSVGMGDEKEN